MTGTLDLSFPAAFDAHNHCYVEWLYFTGVLDDDRGGQLSFFFTLFRTQAANFANAHILDMRDGRVVCHAEGLSEPRPLDLAAGGIVPAFEEAGHLGLTHLGDGTYRAEVVLPDRDVELRATLAATAPPVLHGEGGVIAQSSNGPSAYYSLLDMKTSVTLRQGGEATAMAGACWHDHQWGDFAYGPDGFDEACYLFYWFSCRFDSGEKLMVYRFHDRWGRELSQYLAATYVDADGHARPVDDVRLTVGDETFSPPAHPGERYPIAWAIASQSLGLDITMRAAHDDQIIEQKATGERYYEGVLRITGDRTGYAYAELGLSGTSMGEPRAVRKERCLSHYGLRKAAPFLGLLARYVFPFHGLAVEDFFTYAPTLTFIESTIYQLDDYLERSHRGLEGDHAQAFRAVRDTIAALLDEVGCLDDRLAALLDDIVHYCELESRLMAPGAVPDEADLLRASALRTIDLRILHHVLFRLRGVDYDEGLLAFFRPVEARWDIEEDLDQYADDVREDNFNIYRMYARAYGAEAPARLRARIEALEAQALERLAALPAKTREIAGEVYRAYRAAKPETAIPDLIDEETSPVSDGRLIDDALPEVRPGAGWGDGGPMRLWPSVGEYPAYDAFAYELMEGDLVRNALYEKAVAARAPGTVALDIGTGQRLLWARACIAAGARHVYAIEEMPETAEKARKLIAELGLGDRITLIEGRSTDVELPEKVDLCVSEIIGCITSAEGVCIALADARRRHLKPGGAMIPYRGQTLVAASTWPDEHGTPTFHEQAVPYAHRIFEHTGGPFDVRVLAENLGPQHMLSAGGLFEDDCFEETLSTKQTRTLSLRIERGGRLDGFALWMRLWCDPDGDYIDAIRDEITWLPVFLPVFYPGVQVEAGDEVQLTCERTLSKDGVHPDYRVSGRLIGSTGERPFDFASPYAGGGFRQSPFYAQLFADWPG